MTHPQPVQAALQRIQRVVVRRPELQRLGEINARLLAALFPEESEGVPAPVLSIAAKGAERVPLFQSVSLSLDEGRLRRHWTAICQILAENDERSPARQLAGTVTGTIAGSAADRSLDLVAQAVKVLLDGPESFREWLVARELDAALGLTILRLSCLPLLAPVAESEETSGRQSAWRDGNCPLCGNWPFLAELRGLEQWRWLRCGWCAAQWQVDRLFCPYCGNRDHRQHHDLFIDGLEQGNRLSACGVCEQSLPAIPTLARLSTPELLVAEMETLHWRLGPPPAPDRSGKNEA